MDLRAIVLAGWAVVALTAATHLSAAAGSTLELQVPAEGVVLSASIALPPAYRSVVLWLPGSGPVARTTPGRGTELRGLVGEYCAAHAIAFCTFDKRGTGTSGGDLGAATVETLTQDAVAVLAAVREHTSAAGVTEIVVAGHSEGAILAARLARDPAIGPVRLVLFGPPMLPGAEFLVAQQLAQTRSRGADAATLECHQRYLRSVVALMAEHHNPIEAGLSLRARYLEIFGAQALASSFDSVRFALQTKAFLAPWATSLLNFDPAEDLRQASVPVVLVFARDDVIVPLAENLGYARKRGLLDQSRVRVLVETGRDHFFSATTSSAREMSATLADAFARPSPATYAAGKAREGG